MKPATVLSSTTRLRNVHHQFLHRNYQTDPQQNQSGSQLAVNTARRRLPGSCPVYAHYPSQTRGQLHQTPAVREEWLVAHMQQRQLLQGRAGGPYSADLSWTHTVQTRHVYALKVQDLEVWEHTPRRKHVHECGLGHRHAALLNKDQGCELGRGSER